MRNVSAVLWILPRGSRVSGFASASAAWVDGIHLPSAKRLIEILLVVSNSNCEPESSIRKSSIGSVCSQINFLLSCNCRLSSTGAGAVQGIITTCRASPVKTSATNNRPRAFSEIVTRNFTSGCVAATASPALRSSRSSPLRKLDDSGGGSGVRFWKSSETVARRCSREEIRAASCTAASCIDCASARQDRTGKNNSPNTTRLIGHIILFACNQLDDESQKGEGQHQGARKAESQHEGDLRKVAEECEEVHCPAPTLP